MQDVEQITGQALYCAGLLRKGESLSGNVVFKDLVLKCLTPSGTGAPVNWRKLFKDFPELIDRLEDEIKAMEDIGGFFQSRADTDKGSSSTDNSGITRYSGKLAAGMEPVPGYRLEEKLGEGGFGEVWRAIGPGGFPVALKFVGLKEKTKAFELRSLDLLKSLRHPNLLVTFGSWETENNLVIAMELADCSLHDVFKKYQSRNSSGIPFDELINYMEGASEGIDYLNSYQSPFSGDSKKVAIQHRDIKPQNLLIVGGKAKIGDFGLIRKLETNETSHTGMMTSAFAAPEFFEGKTSNNSDQYSLAVSYCLLRGGSLPFSGSIVQILKGHNSPDLTMLPEIERKTVKKALAKNPTDRWQNCKSFIDALKVSNFDNSLKIKPDKPGFSGGIVTGMELVPGHSHEEKLGEGVFGEVSGVQAPEGFAVNDLQESSINVSLPTIWYIIGHWINKYYFLIWIIIISLWVCFFLFR